MSNKKNMKHGKIYMGYHLHAQVLNKNSTVNDK